MDTPSKLLAQFITAAPVGLIAYTDNPSGRGGCGVIDRPLTSMVLVGSNCVGTMIFSYDPLTRQAVPTSSTAAPSAQQLTSCPPTAICKLAGRPSASASSGLI